MLSRNIEKVSDAIAAELADGATMAVSLQWTLVDIMNEWKRQAIELEGFQTQETYEEKELFRPVIIGGTDAEISPLMKAKK